MFSFKKKLIFKLFTQFSIFTIYGLISNIISLLLYYFFLKVLILEYIFSKLISSLLIVTINFFVYTRIFKSIKTFSSMMRYALTQILFNFCHTLLIIFMVERLTYDKVYSHFVSNIFLACLIFFVFKFFVFKNSDKE